MTKRLITEPVRLDILAAETIGTARDGAIEALLEANPGLADGGPYLDAPKAVDIPARPATAPVAAVNPWE